MEALRSQLKSFQERMKRVEESLLSRDYKKHIEVRGSAEPVALWAARDHGSVWEASCPQGLAQSFSDGPRQRVHGMEPGGQLKG